MSCPVWSSSQLKKSPSCPGDKTKAEYNQYTECFIDLWEVEPLRGELGGFVSRMKTRRSRHRLRQECPFL